ncbi:MAG: hypothetical protein IH956_08625 [Chloroflexi bacterium]|nr:hypothetical protein [Chloroflexota bacterium]
MKWREIPLLRAAPALRRYTAGRGGLLAVLAVLAAPIIMAVLAGCGGGGTKGTAAVGRSLEIHLGELVIAQKIFYEQGPEHRIIQARASNRQLALVNVIIVNRTSTVIPLKIEKEVAKLGDRRGQRIDALDPFESSKVTETPELEEENKYLPFLWDEVELPRQTQVSGWMVFEVPKGLRLGSFWWDEVDFIILDFPE